MAQKFDLIIVGGGMVGLSLAALLKDSPLKIAIIESQEIVSLDQQADSMTYRVSAIARSSQKILQSVGAWELLPAHRLCHYQAMCVWDENTSAELNFSAQQLAEADLGHIIENALLQSALFQSLNECPQVTFFTQNKVEQIQIEQQHAQLFLVNGERLECRLLVGADGAQSWVREATGFETHEVSYQQQAIVANVTCQKAHEHTAWQRFLATGPIAFLPMAQAHLCSIVWSVDNPLAEELMSLPADLLERRIAAAFDYRLGEVELASEVAKFPLFARHSQDYVQERVVLIGDAAHSIHPLAGLGVNLGFVDAAELSQQLIEIINRAGDIGHKALLRPFERKRKAHNHSVQKAMTLLNWGFQQRELAAVMLRSLGMNFIERSSLAKETLIKQAMYLN